MTSTDFAIELRRLDDLAERLDTRITRDLSASAAARHVACLFQRAVLTGLRLHFEELERLLDDALARHPDWPDLWLVRAKVDFHVHRFDDAQRDLDRLAALVGDCSERRALAADIDLEFGRHAEAGRVYRRLALDEPTWENICRLANLEIHLGRPAEAIRYYARAAQEITAKEMRAFAWLQVQWGDAELCLGRPAEARRRYQVAVAAYSGYWLLEDRVAQMWEAT
jgi:tetratricopeptide (TPR) repeat protein